eukprot:193770-Rhodomonas_salina.2
MKGEIACSWYCLCLLHLISRRGRGRDVRERERERWDVVWKLPTGPYGPSYGPYGLYGGAMECPVGAYRLSRRSL